MFSLLALVTGVPGPSTEAFCAPCWVESIRKRCSWAEDRSWEVTSGRWHCSLMRRKYVFWGMQSVGAAAVWEHDVVHNRHKAFLSCQTQKQSFPCLHRAGIQGANIMLLLNKLIIILRWEIYWHCPLLSSSSVWIHLNVHLEDHHFMILFRIFLKF